MHIANLHNYAGVLRNQQNSQVEEAWNLMMSVYIGYFDRDWCLDDYWAEFELFTHLTYSESKMAAKMAVIDIGNIEIAVTLDIIVIEPWFWCLGVCFQYPGI